MSKYLPLAEQTTDDHVVFSRQRTSGSLGVYPVSQITSATAPYVVLDSDTSVRLPLSIAGSSPQSAKQCKWHWLSLQLCW